MKIISKVNGLIIPFTKETHDVLNLDNQKFAQIMQENTKEESQNKRAIPKNKKQEQESEFVETL